MIVGCPSCGAQVDFRAGSSVLVVCGHCRAAVVRQDRDIRLVGRVAEIVSTDSRFSLGLTGRYRGVPFRIAGRLQLDTGFGPWDEWYCAFDDGRWGWLAEAEGRLLLTFAVTAPPIPFSEVHAGNVYEVGDRPHIVTEKGTGRYVAAAGELPTYFVVGGTYRYLDLSAQATALNRHGFATLDYGQQEVPESAYVGDVVPFIDLGLPLELETQRLSLARPPEGKALICPHCGGTLPSKAPDKTQRIVCGFCNSMLDASQGTLQWLAVLENQNTIPKIPIGATGQLKGLVPAAASPATDSATWVVIGYMTRACSVAGRWYYWDEYLLFDEHTRSYRFLLEQDGHWAIIEPIEVGDVKTNDIFSSTVQYRGTTFKRFSAVDAVVVRVLGEFYWRVAIGETTNATDYVYPDKGLMLSQELQYGEREELHWSLGHHVEGKALFKSFGLDAQPPHAFGIGPVQPNTLKPGAKGVTYIAVVLLVLWAVSYAMNVTSARNQVVYSESIELPLPAVIESTEPLPDGAEAPQPAFFSEPFDVPIATNVEATIQTNLSQTYLWVGGALIHEKTGTVYEFELEPSRYSGREGGESWSEGSLSKSVTIGNIEAGRYILRLQPMTEKLTPEQAAALGRVMPTSMDCTLRNDSPVYSLGIFALLFIFAVPIGAWLRVASFEKRRWYQSNTR